MRFMLIAKADKNSETGIPPNAGLMAAIGKLGEEMTKAGVLLETGGLAPTSKGARLRLSGGKVTVTDGPFAEVKELIGGYWMIQVKSKEEAVDWASRCPAQDGDVIEVRQVQELSDFPPEVQKVAR